MLGRPPPWPGPLLRDQASLPRGRPQRPQLHLQGHAHLSPPPCVPGRSFVTGDLNSTDKRWSCFCRACVSHNPGWVDRGPYEMPGASPSPGRAGAGAACRDWSSLSKEAQEKNSQVSTCPPVCLLGTWEGGQPVLGWGVALYPAGQRTASGCPGAPHGWGHGLHFTGEETEVWKLESLLLSSRVRTGTQASVVWLWAPRCM